MPTAYAPGTRKRRKKGKVYTNRYWVVRGRLDDGSEREVACKDAYDKDSALENFYIYKRAMREHLVVPEKATATFGDAVTVYKAARNLGKLDDGYLDKLEKHFKDKRLCTFKPGDVHKAARKLYPDAKGQTLNRQVIRPIRAMWKHALKNGLCDWMEFDAFPETEPERPIVFPEHMDGLIHAVRSDKHLYAILHVFKFQGWRVTETLNAKREWFDFGNNSVRRFVSKSQKWRWTALDAGTADLLKRLPKREDGRLFPWKDRHDFYDAIEPHLEKLGIHWTPHMSRRGFATALLEEGADLKAIAAAGAWESINSVSVYADANLDVAKNTLQRLRKRGKKREKPAKLA